MGSVVGEPLVWEDQRSQSVYLLVLERFHPSESDCRVGEQGFVKVEFARADRLVTETVDLELAVWKVVFIHRQFNDNGVT
jgi:hypothetical protein